MLRFVFSYVLMMCVQLSYLEKKKVAHIRLWYYIVLYDHGFSTRFIDAHYTIPLSYYQTNDPVIGR